MSQPRPRRPRKPQVRQAQQARSKATVHAIVEASARILAEDSWAALNTNAIAQRAGVSVGSIYEYFPDKQAIVDVILDQHLSKGEGMLAEAARNLKGVHDVGVLVAALVHGFVQVHSDNPRLHRALSSEAELSKAQRQRVSALRNGVIMLVAEALSGQVDKPSLKATLLVDTADALAHRWLIDDVGLPVKPETLAAEAIKMLGGYVSS
ncbi:MAG: TetR/AcrR family transcriptional regulator [Caulobacterales bacterium]